MLVAAWIVGSLVFVQFDPQAECWSSGPRHEDRVVAQIIVKNNSDILWGGTKITQEQFREYLRQERTRKDLFEIYRDETSAALTLTLANEIRNAGLTFSKRPCGVP